MSNLTDNVVFIIGLGQIGGSIGLDLVARKTVSEVVGYDVDASTMESAVSLGAVHRCAGSVEEGVSAADFIILCTPIRDTIRIAAQVCLLAGNAKTVMDVAGTKGQLRENLNKVSGLDNFVGTHPIAGTERIGIDGAQIGQFVDRTFVLTPCAETRENHTHAVEELILQLGGSPVIMSAGDHDRAIALTSHLPYVLALSLAKFAGRRFDGESQARYLMGDSFRSATRVAASSPRLTLDMLLTNRNEITPVIDELIQELSAIRCLIADQGEEELHSLILNAKRIVDEASHG